jgi:hypothetical protein
MAISILPFCTLYHLPSLWEAILDYQIKKEMHEFKLFRPFYINLIDDV